MRTKFFDSLIDDFGIWQHTDGQKILASEGYSLDDAARGLIVCQLLGRPRQSEVLLSYIEKSYKDSRFYGFASADRKFDKKDYPASEDATSQAYWAASLCQKNGFEVKRAKRITSLVSDAVSKSKHIRGKAYGLLGAIYVDRPLADKLANKIITSFKKATKDWYWPEEVVTYGNGIIPYSLLRLALISGDQRSLSTGLKALDFLDRICTVNRVRGPIGNDGWFKKDMPKAPDYSQQPVDAAYMVLACLAAFKLTKDEKYQTSAEQWASWFDGQNIAKTPMIDPDSLKCFDGINRDGINQHSGAESNICYLLTKLVMGNGQLV